MSEMIDMMKALAVKEGYNLTAMPDVRILRSDRPLARTPVLYDPGSSSSARAASAAILVSEPIYMMNSTIWRFRYRCHS